MSDQHKVDESNLEDSDVNIENWEGTGEENDTPEGKNKNTSNFKKMHKKNKELEAALAEERKKNLELQKWKEEEDTLSEATPDEKTRIEIFWLKNPEANDHLADILKTSKAHNMTHDQAWSYLKATKPKESETQIDFKWKWKSKNTWDIDYKSMSIEESSSLDKEWRAAWRKANSFG